MGKAISFEPVSTTAPAPSTAAEFERSVGVMPMEEIDALLQSTEEDWAAGASLFGPGGMYDDMRKIALSQVACALRAAAKGAKITEAQIDQESHAHEDYVSKVAELHEMRTQYLELDARRKRILMRAARGDALLRAAGRGL